MRRGDLLDQEPEVPRVIGARVEEVAAGVGGIPEPIAPLVDRPVGPHVGESERLGQREELEVVLHPQARRAVAVDRDDQWDRHRGVVRRRDDDLHGTTPEVDEDVVGVGGRRREEAGAEGERGDAKIHGSEKGLRRMLRRRAREAGTKGDPPTPGAGGSRAHCADVKQDPRESRSHHWNVTARPSVKFDVAPMPDVSRCHAVKFHDSPGSAVTGPVGCGICVRSIAREISPVRPVF